MALRGHESAVTGAAFSPDGTRVVTASNDRTARVWDVASGRQLLVLQEHANSVIAAAFSPKRRPRGHGLRRPHGSHLGCGKRYAIDGSSWPRNSGGQRGLQPHGTRVLTTSYDKTARIWDAAEGEEIMALRGHGDRVWGATFSPDGSRVATASWDGTARIWQVPGTVSTEFLVRAQQIAPRCLTPDERAQVFLGAESPAWCTAIRKWPYDPATLAVEAQALHRLRNTRRRLLVSQRSYALIHHLSQPMSVVATPTTARNNTISQSQTSAKWSAWTPVTFPRM